MSESDTEVSIAKLAVTNKSKNIENNMTTTEAMNIDEIQNNLGEGNLLIPILIYKEYDGPAVDLRLLTES